MQSIIYIIVISSVSKLRLSFMTKVLLLTANDELKKATKIVNLMKYIIAGTVFSLVFVYFQ